MVALRGIFVRCSTSLFRHAFKCLRQLALVLSIQEVSIGSRTLARPDISSNWQKVELTSEGTQVLQPSLAIFLAAMSSSRSDDVTNSVCLFVCSHLVKFRDFQVFEARCL